MGKSDPPGHNAAQSKESRGISEDRKAIFFKFSYISIPFWYYDSSLRGGNIFNYSDYNSE